MRTRPRRPHAALIVLGLLATGPGAALAQQQAQPRGGGGAAQQPPGLGEQVDQQVQACLGVGARGAEPSAAQVQACLDRQRAALEPRLQRALQQATARLRPDRRAAFDGVQAAWIAYRDRACDYAGTEPDAGADAVVDRAGCLLEFTVGRIVELELAQQIQAEQAPPSTRR